MAALHLSKLSVLGSASAALVRGASSSGLSLSLTPSGSSCSELLSAAGLVSLSAKVSMSVSRTVTGKAKQGSSLLMGSSSAGSPLSPWKSSISVSTGMSRSASRLCTGLGLRVVSDSVPGSGRFWCRA